MDPNYLDTKQLEAFVAVVSIGSMTGAAKALGRSQSVITRLIQELEEELGFALLHRNGPRITPTQQGLAFHEQADLFLSGLRTIGARARAIGGGAPLPIHVATLPSLAAGVVPAALARLDPADLPDRIHLNSMAAENIVQAVAAQTADLGLTTLPLDHPGLEVHWTAEVACIAVVARHHSLAARSVITAEDLAQERIITTHNPHRLRRAINEALEAAGVAPSSVIDSNASFVSIALARAGLGVAIVESLTSAGLPASGVVQIPLSVHIPFRWGIVTPVGRPANSLVTKLIAAIKEGAGF
ncbi:LysR family transcriptional regulator [Falsirhodobacter xinxiangensis]|uniref:LysR family transcriptional regulator n=1 Tax=Falsirhodobacter xinxiangensis TaxID=2530049 RepID=UPI0010A9FD3C|nr:LysR family transcriptional regulator [Rhodobacter xinxiangensis]